MNVYSLSVCVGGLLTIASYNRRNSNIYRDAIIINVFDFSMNILSGLSAFCIVGFLAHILDREIEEVISGGVF